MEEWLSEFAFREPQSWLIYFGAVTLLLFVAGITVTSRTILAPRANPVSSLRDE